MSKNSHLASFQKCSPSSENGKLKQGVTFDSIFRFLEKEKLTMCRCVCVYVDIGIHTSQYKCVWIGITHNKVWDTHKVGHTKGHKGAKGKGKASKQQQQHTHTHCTATEFSKMGFLPSYSQTHPPFEFSRFRGSRHFGEIAHS